jgi:ABC-type Zn uptake system ZnuABC Zn-binding protein ZnuA
VVAASIFPLYDVVRRVAGEAEAVALVLPPGRMDHGFDPRPQDLVRLSGVELAFGVGLGLDPWLQRVLAASTDGRARVIDLGPQLDPRPLPTGVLDLEEAAPGAPAHEHGPLDPHVFLDPERMARAAALVAEALTARDPPGREGYGARGAQVAAELRALDAELRRRASSWKKRTIVTFHGSFFYFAERYGLEVAAVVAPLPGREPTPRYVADVLGAIRQSGAAALFSEPQLDPRPARLIAAESGLPLFELDPIGGGPGALTYEAFLLKNAAVLDEALR